MNDNQASAHLWLNGEAVPWSEATVHMTEVGVATCGEVHEGIRGYWNRGQEQLYIFRPDEHMKRLANSAKMVNLELEFSPEELIDASIGLLKAAHISEDCYIHAKAFPRGGVFFVLDGPTTTEILIHAFPLPSELGTSGSLSCCVSSWVRIGDNVMPPRVKCASNYRNSMLAIREARTNGYDDAIILNSQGKIAEASVAAVFMVRDGTAFTPTVTSGILESITRNTLLELLNDVLDVPVVEREIDRTELYIADEVFCCGTGREIKPITSIDRFPIGTGDIGPITKQIEMLYHDIVRGSNPDYLGWCLPVHY